MHIPSSLSEELRGKFLQNESLDSYTSFRTGGPADYLFIPADLDDLSHFMRGVQEIALPITWLGLGSNTLIRDGGLEGVVVITQGALSSLSQSNNLLVRAEAGVSCAQLARFTARAGLAGLEFMAGIPGTVGGALAMNAGCFGGETWRCVQQVETINRYGDIQLRPRCDFEISYRHVNKNKDEWFVAGHFLLQPGNKKTLLAKIKNLLEKRNQTQPTGTANCGSVFRNPPNHFAGQLIEQCGLKGERIGGAKVSEKHANFIINEGATSADIENLIAHIRSIVLEKTSVRLFPEVCILGRKD